MRLYLIRHAQTAWNLSECAQGHSDIELDCTGLSQAKSLSSSFEDSSVKLILSSDLQRSVQTAEPIAEVTGAPIETLPELRERCYGEWEGRPYREIAALIRDLAAIQKLEEVDVRPAGGESSRDVWTRLDPVLNRINQVNNDLAIVTHGGTSALLLAKLLRGTIQTARSFRFGNTAVTELQRRFDGLWSLVRFADTCHLAKPSKPMIDAHFTTRS